MQINVSSVSPPFGRDLHVDFLLRLSCDCSLIWLDEAISKVLAPAKTYRIHLPWPARATQANCCESSLRQVLHDHRDRRVKCLVDGRSQCTAGTVHKLQRRPKLLHQTDRTLRTTNRIFPCDLFDLGNGFSKAQTGRPRCLPVMSAGSEPGRETPFVFFGFTHSNACNPGRVATSSSSGTACAQFLIWIISMLFVVVQGRSPIRLHPPVVTLYAPEHASLSIATGDVA